VFTIREELGTVNGLTIAIVGDLLNGRTVHSLVRLLSLYRVRLYYISTLELRMPRNLLEELDRKGIPQQEYTELESCLPFVDVLYMTRIQRERFPNEVDYQKICGCYRITPETLTMAKSRMLVMHPLPRLDEISELVDSDPRAVYFRQLENGLFVRMALLLLLLKPIDHFHFS